MRSRKALKSCLLAAAAFSLSVIGCGPSRQEKETAADLILLETHCLNLSTRLEGAWRAGIRRDSDLWYLEFVVGEESQIEGAKTALTQIRTAVDRDSKGKAGALLVEMYSGVSRLCGLATDPTGVSLNSLTEQVPELHTEFRGLQARAEVELDLPAEPTALRALLSPAVNAALRSGATELPRRTVPVEAPPPAPAEPLPPPPLTIQQWHARFYVPLRRQLVTSAYPKVGQSLRRGTLPRLQDCEEVAGLAAELLQVHPSPDQEVASALADGFSAAMDMGEACALRDRQLALKHLNQAEASFQRASELLLFHRLD